MGPLLPKTNERRESNQRLESIFVRIDEHMAHGVAGRAIALEGRTDLSVGDSLYR